MTGPVAPMRSAYGRARFVGWHASLGLRSQRKARTTSRTVASSSATSTSTTSTADRFLSLLRLSTRRFRWSVDAYTLTTNHFHLVVTTNLDRLSGGMHLLGFRYAQGFNERHARIGHLFQGRFGAKVVDEETYFFDVCAYVFDNPVRSRICERAGDYPWSGGDYFPLFRG